MRKYQWLDQIDCPADLKRLPEERLDELCSEIRHFLVEAVSKTGGHLASNLGAVELTVAIHRVFDAPKDDILFDVGHQCYVHKMLTGRRNRFDTLRQFDGISGFDGNFWAIHIKDVGHNFFELLGSLDRVVVWVVFG